MIADKKPFLVVAGQVAVASQQVMERAKELHGKLLAAGFDKTTIHDSREFQGLTCCYQTVVVNRFADQASAESLQKRLKEKGFEATVRRGF